MLSSVNTVNTIHNTIKKYNSKENFTFCCNLTQSYSKYIYRVFVEYTRLEIIKYTSAHSQNETKRLRG